MTWLFPCNLVVHADWSCHNTKRWFAKATLDQEGSFRAFAPERVEDPIDFLPRLWEENQPQGATLVGFDFPIGLPIEYARKAGIQNFLEILPHLGVGKWGNFYKPAKTAGQISIHQPFYPAKPGGTYQDQLRKGLGTNELRRVCEKHTGQRRAACPLFWTLGAQQVGKAALDGWQKVLQSGLHNPSLSLRIWPFSGKLNEILQTGNIVVAETYPAEFYTHLGIEFHSTRCKPGGKRSQSARKCVAAHLPGWAADHRIILEPDLIQDFNQGFSDTIDGEDRFDAAVGLLGMLNLLAGCYPLEEPLDEEIRHIEGWILGQKYTF